MGRSGSAAISAALCALLAISATAIASPPAESAGKSGAKLRVLIARDAHSPVLRALQKRNGVKVARSGKARHRSPRRYDLLIVDGDVLSAKTMARHKALRRFTRAHNAVLALDVSPKHHGRAIAKRTKFEALAQGGGHASDAFLYRRGTLGSTPRTLMVDAPRLKPYAGKELSKRKRAKLIRAQARQMAGSVRDTVTGGDAALEDAAPGDDSGIPAELQHVGWSYAVVGTQAAPAGYWTDNTQQVLVEPPKPGKQISSWTINHHFDVYLDNGEGRPQGNNQIITYTVDGHFSPKQTNGSFVHMYDKWKLAGGEYSDPLERAWWTGAFGFDVTPPKLAPHPLTLEASLPQTPNKESEYTSGQDFTVGFSKSEGPGAEYSVHNEKTYSVPDWSVENRTTADGTELNWLFSSRDPCDIRPGHFDESKCFAIKFGEGGTPNLPNELSLGLVDANAVGRWKTPGLLNDQNGSLDFLVKSEVTLADTRCELWVFLGYYCHERNRAYKTAPVGPPAQHYRFDASIVNPIPIKSLELKPNPASGDLRDKVTGTVTLEKKAPMDVTVELSSDSKNASLGKGTSFESHADLTIKEGTDHATFEVLTNANDFGNQTHVVADITAFYAEPTTKQLCIQIKPNACNPDTAGRR